MQANIIDTLDGVSAYGMPDPRTAVYAVADATVVRRLRDAGAVIYGKTVTTEFAAMHPGPTRNPHGAGPCPAFRPSDRPSRLRVVPGWPQSD